MRAREKEKGIRKLFELVGVLEMIVFSDFYVDDTGDATLTSNKMVNESWFGLFVDDDNGSGGPISCSG